MTGDGNTLPFVGPVLVGADDSAGSRDALALGRMLADAMRSQMLSVYVHHFEDVGALLSGGRATEALEMIDEAAAGKNRRARALARAAAATPLPMSTAPTVAAGLHQAAMNSHAGLIVVGPRRSRSPFTYALSTAQRLLARRTHVVAIAPSNYRQSDDLEVVGWVFDESPAVHQWAVAFAERSDADLHLLAAPHSRRRFAGWLATLERAANPDLLISGSRGLSPVLAGFRSDLASVLTRNGRFPTIVVPHRPATHLRRRSGSARHAVTSRRTNTTAAALAAIAT
jgi:nucleotide-binding universal stress UspA family protein